VRSSVTLGLDKLHALLLQAPTLVASYGRGDPAFVDAVMAWLTQVESTLQSFAMARVAAVSALKVRLLAARDGVIENAFVGFVPSTRSRRKTQMAVAALLFNQGQEIVGNLHEGLAARRDEALKYIRQMAMLMEQQGVIPSRDGADRSSALVRLFASMRANPASAVAARHVLTQVNYADALRLLDETLEQWGLQP
jgi:hypothetical protein